MKNSVSHFQILKNQICNQRGDILLIAMVMLGISLISTLVMLNYSTKVEAMSKRPRVKSMMTSVEAKVRAALLTPTTYTGCKSDLSDPANLVTGRDSCALNASRITSLGRVMPDAQCPPNHTCGISVTVDSFNKDLALPDGTVVTRVVASIHYTGTDFNLADVVVTTDVPADILQSTGVYKCPSSAPKFMGFTAKGEMNCVALPALADPTKILTSIDINAIKTTDTPLPGIVQCSPDQVVSKVEWGNGGTSLSATCASRSDPFATFGFSPKPAPAGNLVFTPNN